MLHLKGIDQETLDGVNCPIGLAIGAESPEEIAIAVLAEILAAHKGVNLEDMLPVVPKFFYRFNDVI